MLKLDHYISRVEELREAADHEIALEIEADLSCRAYSFLEQSPDRPRLETSNYRIKFLSSGYIACEPIERFGEARFGHPAYNSFLVFLDSSLRYNPFGTEALQEKLREIFEVHGFNVPQRQVHEHSGLIIRPFLASDSASLFKLLESERDSVAKVGFSSLPFSPSSTPSWLKKDSLVQYIAINNANEVMGLCGAMERMHGVPGTQSSTLFYLVSQSAQGRGLAGSLSLAAMRGHQELRPDVSHVVVHTEPDNVSSRRVWQKLGLIRDPSTDYSARVSGKDFNLLGASARIDETLLTHDTKKSLEVPKRSTLPKSPNTF